ncbi:hypothetical protein [Bradyrhizobium liaoningense]
MSDKVSVPLRTKSDVVNERAEAGPIARGLKMFQFIFLLQPVQVFEQ